MKHTDRTEIRIYLDFKLKAQLDIWKNDNGHKTLSKAVREHFTKLFTENYCSQCGKELQK